MPDLTKSQFNPKVTNSLPSIFRNIMIAEATIVGVNLGMRAVSSIVRLEINSTEEAPQSVLEDEYQGILGINHSGKSEQTFDDSGATIPDNSSEVVNQGYYLESRPVLPTEDNPYPNKSPLLAYN